MHKLIAIARREFMAMVGTKAFLFTLIMMPVLMLGGVVLMPLLQKIGGQKEREIVVADASGKLFDSIKAAADMRNKLIKSATSDEQADEEDGEKNPLESADIWKIVKADRPSLDDQARLALSDRIRDGKLYAFVEVPEKLEPSDTGQILLTFVSQDAVLSDARRWIEAHVREKVRVARLTELGIDSTVVDKASVPVSAQPKLPFKANEDGEVASKDGGNLMASLFLPFGVMMLMFMVIFLAAQPMLESGMEEKTNRIAELLLGSVSPTTLMTGKLIGNVCGSFVIFAIYGIGGYFMLNHNGWGDNLPWAVMPWLIVFQILGVLFFSSIFLTIGASVSELKEAQSMLLPVWLVLMLPMMTWFLVIKDPNGVLPVALSFFPPSAPLMMSLRMSTGQTIPSWQLPVSALVMLIATGIVVVVAGRIYRAGLLKSDSAKSIGQLFKRLRTAE